MTATEAWQALQDGLAVDAPACLGDARFTDDNSSATELRPICEGCPVMTLCADYARAAPRGSIHGVWFPRELFRQDDVFNIIQPAATASDREGC